MKIVLFGEDVFTSTVLGSLLRNGYSVLMLVCPIYKDDSNYKSMEKLANKHNICFIRHQDVNSDIIKQKISIILPDLIISVHLRRILKSSLFSLARKGAINVHPSLLPKYRGLSPQHQALIHGDSESGITVHYITEEVDSGAIVLQERVPLAPKDYIYDFQMKLLTVYSQIVIKAIQLLENETFSPIKQDNSNASYFGKLTLEDRRIILTKTKHQTYNLIRAVSKPYKGAFYDNLIIWKTDFLNETEEKELINQYEKVGIYHHTNDTLVIRLKDGILICDDFEYV